MLKANGSIYFARVRVGGRLDSFLKPIMYAKFGAASFLNEIIWHVPWDKRETRYRAAKDARCSVSLLEALYW